MLARLVLRSTNFDHEVVSLSPLGLVSETLRASGIPVSSLNMHRRRLTPFALVRLRRHIQRVHPTILQTWMAHADLMATLAGLGTGVPLVWNVRNTYDSRNSRTAPAVCARLSSHPDVVIANSFAGKASYEAIGYHPRAWQVIPNGFDTERFRADRDAPIRVKARLRISPTNLVVAMIARRHPMKDHETFLRAARIVAAETENVKFVLIGGGITTDIQLSNLIGQLGLHDAVLRPGLQAEVQDVLPGLDLVVLSSKYGEGLPNAVGEAMSCGVPCVVTDVGDAARLVGDTGLVVSPSSVEALAGGMIQMLRLPAADRWSMGTRARSRIESHYSMAGAVAEYEALYSRLDPARAGERSRL